MGVIYGLSNIALNWPLSDGKHRHGIKPHKHTHTQKAAVSETCWRRRTKQLFGFTYIPLDFFEICWVNAAHILLLFLRHKIECHLKETVCEPLIVWFIWMKKKYINCIAHCRPFQREKNINTYSVRNLVPCSHNHKYTIHTFPALHFKENKYVYAL